MSTLDTSALRLSEPNELESPTDDRPAQPHRGPRLGVAPAVPDSRPPVEHSLEALYREHYRFIWRSALRMGVPRDQVEDAVQDVFVVVSERLSDFEGRSSIRTWLFSILFRVASSRRRKDARAHRKEAPATSVPLPADENLARKQAAEMFARVLDELDADQRAVFVLFEIDRTPAKDIADAMGLSVNTVYSRLRLARSKVQRGLQRLQARDARADAKARRS